MVKGNGKAPPRHTVAQVCARSQAIDFRGQPVGCLLGSLNGLDDVGHAEDAEVLDIDFPAYRPPCNWFDLGMPQQHQPAQPSEVL